MHVGKPWVQRPLVSACSPVLCRGWSLWSHDMTQLLSVGNIMHGRVLESLSEGLVDDFFISCCAVNLSLSCVIRERTACVCVYRSLAFSLSLSLSLSKIKSSPLSDT